MVGSWEAGPRSAAELKEAATHYHLFNRFGVTPLVITLPQPLALVKRELRTGNKMVTREYSSEYPPSSTYLPLRERGPRHQKENEHREGVESGVLAG